MSREGHDKCKGGLCWDMQVPDALVLQRVGKETVANRAIATIINDSLQLVSLS